MMIYIYVGCLLLLVYYLFSRNYSYWASKGVPFEKPFLFFGSFYSVVTARENMFEKVREVYNKYKTPYVGLYIFNQPHLLIRSTELLRKILIKDFDKFINRHIATNEKVDPISFHNLFSAKDDAWKNIRTKMSPAFTSGKIKMMLPLIKNCAQDLADYLTKYDGKTIEAKLVTKRYAVDIISSCAFGINSNCLKNDDSEILKIATQLFDFQSFSRNFSLFCFFFIPKFVDIFRLTFLDKAASNYLLDIFKNTIKEREEKKIVRNDLIDLLNTLRKNENTNDKYKFDEIKMASQAIIFFSAGNDTTSFTIAYALYELALHKEIQDRLREEIRETFDKDGDFTYENIHVMKLLDMVVNETLRMYPLTITLNREAATDYTFEETGLRLDKGVSIMVPVAGLHYDAELFPEPEKFIPERFSDPTNIKPYTFMPFGEGPRNCIGQRFALLVVKVALAYMIKDFAFEPTDTTPVPMEFSAKTLILHNKKPLDLKVLKV